MIKEKLIKLVQSKFTGVNATADTRNQYHPLYIEQYLNMAFNTLIYTTFRKDLSNLDQYCKTYHDVPVLHEESTDTYYSLLPVPVVQLPDAANGVRRISGMQNKYTTEYIPLKRDSWDIWAQNNVAQTSKENGYCPRIDRVEYFRKPIHDAVKMDILPLFDSYESTDDIPIPSGADVKLFEIMMALMQGQQPSDKINNNISMK